MKSILIAGAALCVLAVSSGGQVPQTINYQGKLTDAGGALVPDGNYSLTFKLYDVSAGGSALWTEVQSASVSGGLFLVILGSVVPIPLAFDKQYWLGITVSGTELTPRTQLTSSPYSLNSKTVSAPLHLSASVGSSNSVLSGQNTLGGGYGVNGTSTDGPGVYGGSVSSMGVIGMSTVSYGIKGETSNQNSSAIYGRNSGNGNEGLLGSLSSGVGGTSFNSAGVSGTSTNDDGVDGSHTSAVDAGYGIHGTNSGSGSGMYGYATANDDNSAGVIGYNASGNRPGVFGYTGTYPGVPAGGCGVFGYASSGGWGAIGYIASGPGAGVSGQSYSDAAHGVSGSNFGSTGTGVRGSSNNGYGVDGFSSGGVGVYGSSTTGDGLRGEAYAAAKSGIFALNINASGYAGYFTGRVHVNGNLSKLGGSFKIDHPLDPANKFLQHSFVESPDMMNIYNGNTVLDANGEALVTMPVWFEALNQDFRYQLTCIGGFAPVYIAHEISGNQFKIAGGSAGLKVSWMVTGIRHDPYAAAHRIQVEVKKDEFERGRFLSPVELGQPESLGLFYEEKTAEE